MPTLAIPGIAELWPIAALIVLVFGAKKLPELARAMGSSVTQFKKGLKDETDLLEEKSATSDKAETPAVNESNGSEVKER